MQIIADAYVISQTQLTQVAICVTLVNLCLIREKPLPFRSRACTAQTQLRVDERERERGAEIRL